MTTTYTTKQFAIEAARGALKTDAIKDPMSGVHFRVEQAGEEWAWHEIDINTGLIATGERIADGAVQGKPAPVTVVPPKGAAKVRTPQVAAPWPVKLGVAPPPKAKAAAKKTAAAPAAPVKLTRDQQRIAKIKAADARNAAPKPAKAPAAPKAPKGPSTTTRKALAEASARTGKLPPALDFSKPTHARYRKVLATLEAAVKAKNLKAVKAIEINPISSSRVMLHNYRHLCVLALEAQAAKAKGSKPAAAQKAA